MTLWVDLLSFVARCVPTSPMPATMIFICHSVSKAAKIIIRLFDSWKAHLPLATTARGVRKLTGAVVGVSRSNCWGLVWRNPLVTVLLLDEWMRKVRHQLGFYAMR